VSGSGDSDGNGTADILWHEQASGTAGFWRMVGGANTGFVTLGYWNMPTGLNSGFVSLGLV
jgi:hypothetical protein